MHRTSIAFVDDHPILLDGLISIFSGDESYRVVASGACAADAISISNSLKPSILVIDLNMPDDTFSAMAVISRDIPETKMVAFTAAAGVGDAVKALELGARGYVLKGCSADELRVAIRTVLRGETFITQSLAVKVITSLRTPPPKPAAVTIRLSVREDQIVKLLFQGKMNKEIALELDICEKTVKHYMTILMQKFNVRNRVEVVIAAQKLTVSNSEVRKDSFLS